MTRINKNPSPALNVLPYRFNRNVCSEYLLFVKNVNKGQWYTVTIESDGNAGIKVQIAERETAPEKNIVKQI